MKKIILALSILSVTLAACGSSTPATETPGGDSTATPDATATATDTAPTAAPTGSAEAAPAN